MIIDREDFEEVHKKYDKTEKYLADFKEVADEMNETQEIEH